MIKVLAGCFIFACAFSCNSANQVNNSIMWPEIQPPIAAQKPHLRTIHNDTVNDPYYWMYDYFGKGPDSTHVVTYLAQENEYLDSMMLNTKQFQTELYDEMKARIKEKDESVPVFRNGYFYYSRTETGKQYYKYCRKKGSMQSPEEILLDVDAMAEGKAYFNVSGISISDDNNLLAYGVDEISRRQYHIRVKDLVSGKTLTDDIPNTEGDPCWAADNKTIFYTAKNPVTLLSEKIKRHVLGTDATKDALLYEEKDNTNYISVQKSKDRKHILIQSEGTLSSETLRLDANNPEGTFEVIQPRITDVLYDIYPLKDRYLIRTNLNAKNFRLMECPLDKTGMSHWKEIVPHRSDVLLASVDVYKNFIVLSERKDGLVKLRIMNSMDQSEHYLSFDEATYTANLMPLPDYDANNFRYNYSSMITPATVYDYDPIRKVRTEMKQQEVLGGYDKTLYTTERLTATATDGTKIPISIVYKNSFKKDGNGPLLLYGYGSYGSNVDARFSSTVLSLLNRGFAFAIAHIRGGQELGRQWYEDGKMMKKKNTFTDFIDCGKYLINAQYSSPAHLYAEGGSAGGLLMGAVVNMAPEIWNGIVAAVPFVDVVNTMLDERIPLTTNEYDEWGNPANKAAYEYMKSYAPYENISAKAYPNMLVTTGLHDSQVQYFEPAKWVAKLRALKTDSNALLLHTNMDFGHGGASGRFDYLKDIALKYAFLLKLEGQRP